MNKKEIDPLTQLLAFYVTASPVAILIGIVWGKLGFFLFVAVIVFGLVLISRPIFQRKKKEWLWVVFMVLLGGFLGFICANPVMNVYYTLSRILAPF